MSRAHLVTGYVPLPGRTSPLRGTPQLTYRELGARLLALDASKTFFERDPRDLWLVDFLRGVVKPVEPSAADNPKKNTLLYHAVQHQKNAWLVEAAKTTRAEVLVWVDFGIFSLPSVDENAILRFLENAPTDRMVLPGCEERSPISVDRPCWRFAGGVFSCPRALVSKFDDAVRRTAEETIRTTGVVEWEVNTWARAEAADRLPPYEWRRADHDASLFAPSC